MKSSGRNARHRGRHGIGAILRNVAEMKIRLERMDAHLNSVKRSAQSNAEHQSFMLRNSDADEARIVKAETRQQHPALPPANYIRLTIKRRRSREAIVGSGLFADPAWDMLLDLAAAHAEGKRISVTSLCIASTVPPTTALRYIDALLNEGLIVRVRDQVDRRRTLIELSREGLRRMALYFHHAAPNMEEG